ncbi:MAG: hypothetical protein ACYC1Z_08310 [Georgenia sp.]
MKHSVGTLPHENLVRSIEIYGMSLTPLVRELSRSRLGGVDAAAQAEFT